MKKILFLLAAATCMLLTACDSDNKAYFAFQSEEDGGWGLISAKGKVLFEDEFDNRPGQVHDGCFFVKNGDDMWELYTAEESPKQLGNEYLYVGAFCNGIAPVTEKDKPITLINTKGKVVKTLDKLAGKTVSRLSSFKNGVAVFITDEDLGGLINTKGEVLIKPEYAELSIVGEYVIGLHKKDKDKEFKKRNIHFFNLKGKEISTICFGKKKVFWIFDFFEDKIAVCTGNWEKYKVGILNIEGEWVLKPTSKIQAVSEIQGDYLINIKHDKYGLMKVDGEVILRAKYDILAFVPEMKDRLIAYDDGEAMLIDYKGEPVCEDTFVSLHYLAGTKYFAAEVSSDEFVFIDKNGKEISDKDLEIYRVGSRDYDDYIESDYVDMASVVNALQITKNSIDGLSLYDKVPKIVSRAGEMNDENYSAEDFPYSTWVSYPTKAGIAQARVTVGYDEEFVRPLTRLVDYVYGWGYSETYGYEYKSISPQGISVAFYNEGKIEGKGQALYEALCKQAKALGTVYKNKDNRLVVQIDDSHCAYVEYNGNEDGELVDEVAELGYEYSRYDWIRFGYVVFAIANVSPADMAQGRGLIPYVIGDEEVVAEEEVDSIVWDE